MKTIILSILVVVIVGIIVSCKQKSDKETFESILNDKRVNTKEVGLKEGIEYFQIMENGKTGFRDLDGNIVIKPIFESAEMFSENHSAVEIDGKWGLINKNGDYVIIPKYNYLGSLHEGLLSYRENEKYGFINLNEKVIIEPQFDWVDEFSNGYCTVRNDSGKSDSGNYLFIDKTGKKVFDKEFDYAQKFENGKAKVKLNSKWVYININGEVTTKTE